MYTHTHTHTHVNMHTTHMHKPACVHTHKHMPTYMHTHINTYTSTRTLVFAMDLAMYVCSYGILAQYTLISLEAIYVTVLSDFYTSKTHHIVATYHLPLISDYIQHYNL